jgi:hypothetical protein
MDLGDHPMGHQTQDPVGVRPGRRSALRRQQAPATAKTKVAWI